MYFIIYYGQMVDAVHSLIMFLNLIESWILLWCVQGTI